MRTLKVFKHWDFPKDVSSAIIRNDRFECISNDSYVGWTVQEDKPEKYDGITDQEWEEWEEEWESDEKSRLIDTWLLEQGCKQNEEVILEYSW